MSSLTVMYNSWSAQSFEFREENCAADLSTHAAHRINLIFPLFKAPFCDIALLRLSSHEVWKSQSDCQGNLLSPFNLLIDERVFTDQSSPELFHDLIDYSVQESKLPKLKRICIAN